MGQAEREARLLDAVYRTYGVAASWAPVAGGPAVALTVRRSTEDAEFRFGGQEGLARTNLIHVRVADLEQPWRGDVVTLTPGGAFRISAEPRLDSDGLEWRCEATPA